MRKIWHLRHSGRTATRRRIVGNVDTFGVLFATLGIGFAASGRVVTHHTSNTAHSARTASATTATAAGGYSSGRLMAADPLGGYWTVNWLGVISAHGTAPTFGSPAQSGITLTKPIVGMASTPDGQGYWLVGSDGGVFAYGDAQFYGSTGAIHLNQPIVGLAATPDGLGYWLVASDGGIFTYGDAAFYGSMSAVDVNVLGMIISPSTAGYTLVQLNGAASTFSPSSVASESSSLASYTTQPTVSSLAPNAESSADDCQPTATPTATVDTSLTDVLANETGPGWIGGDATYSTELPSGNEAFVFSDTLIGTSQPSGSASLQGFIHNSELVGSLSDLSTDLLGTTSVPQTLIPDTTDPGDQWQVAATYIENGMQLVFVNEFSPGNPFDRYTGRSGIAVMSIPANGMPTLNSLTLIPTDPDTQWGNAVMQSDGYNYIYGNYGAVATGMFLGMKVARAPLHESLNVATWQYWNGSGWVSGESNAVPLSTTNQLTGVTPQQDGVGYVGVSTAPSVYASNVELSYSCSPQGPWTTPEPVYAIPQIAQYHDEIAYIPTFHPELSSAGSLVVSYNIDTTNGMTDLESDVHQYQPQFLQVKVGTP